MLAPCLPLCTSSFASLSPSQSTLEHVQLSSTAVLTCQLPEACCAALQTGLDLPVFQMQTCLHWRLGTPDSLSSCMIQLWQARAACC